MWKRVVAGVLAAFFFISFGDTEVFGSQTGGYSFGFFWDSDYCGLRFSMIDKSGDVLNIVDIIEHKTAGVGGRTVNLFDDGSPSNSYYAEMMYYNQCKVSVKKAGNAERYGFLSETPVLSWTNDGKPYYWHCLYKEDLKFNNSNVNIDNLVLIDSIARHGNTGTFGVKNYNYVSTDIKKALIEGVNGNDSQFICAILTELGITIDTASQRTIWSSIYSEFVHPEYSIIIEPVYYESIPLFSRNPDGTEYIAKDVVFYGSATELTLGSDLSAYSGYHMYAGGSLYNHANTGLNNNNFFIGVVVQNLALKAAYVGSEFIKILEACELSPVENIDWDYVDWGGSKESLPSDVRDHWGWQTETYAMRADSSIWNEAYKIYRDGFIKDYACGMSVITSSDFIKPQVETFDYTYNTSTDVVTSVKVSNRSSDAYTSTAEKNESTIKNGTDINSAPYAMIGHFVMEKIKIGDDEKEVFAYDNKTYSFNAESLANELGISQFEFYGSLDGLPGKEYPSSFMSFNWKTPEKPCTITFRVDFMNADLEREMVLGTSLEDSGKLPGVKHPYNEERMFGKKNEHGVPDGKTGTAVRTVSIGTGGEEKTYLSAEFICVIEDSFRKNIVEKEPLDTVAITSVKPSNMTFEEQKLFDKNVEIRENFNTYADHTDTAHYEIDCDDVPRDRITSLEWTEYRAEYSGDNIVLTPCLHHVESYLKNDQGELLADRKGKLIRTDQNGLYPAYSDEIGSGYGCGIDFYSYFTPDSRRTDVNLKYNRDLTINGVVYPVSLVTNYAHGAVTFPEFLYKDYYGAIEPLTVSEPGEDTMITRYCLAMNKNSVYYGSGEASDKSRVHFIPPWFPDGEYKISVSMFDAWTPAGQLWFYEDYSVNINGSLYDTWYASRGQNNQKRG